MSKYLEYIENVQNIIEKIKNNGAEPIKNTAEVFKDALVNNKSIYLFGTGHSHMLAEELFYRAGGLLKLNLFSVSP